MNLVQVSSAISLKYQIIGVSAYIDKCVPYEHHIKPKAYILFNFMFSASFRAFTSVKNIIEKVRELP